MPFQSDQILTLDIGAGSVKLGLFVRLRGNGLELASYAIRSLDADPANEEDRLSEITSAIRDILRERQIRPQPVLLSVPGQAVFSRLVRLPPVGPEKLQQIIQYEAQQNVPFPINEVVWDYQLIGSGAGEVDVMLAAIKSEIIEQLTDSVAAAGLQPDLVDVAPMAIYNAVRYNYTDLPSCTLVVDIGARSTDLIFIESDRVFNRSIPVGGNTITQQIMREFNLSYRDAEKLKIAHAFVAFGGAYEAPASEVADKVSKSVRSVMTRLHTEITRSINFYRTQQSGGAPGRILLTGGTSVIPYTDTFLKEKLQIEVDYLNPFLNVAVDPSIDANEIGSKAHLLAGSVGLALRRSLTCPVELNLLPQKIIEEKNFRKKYPFFALSMVAAVLIVLVWCAYFLRLATLGEQRLERLQARVRSLAAIESRMREHERVVSDLQNKFERVAALPVRRSLWLSMLSDIHSRLSEGMWLASVKPVLREKTPPAGSDTELGGAMGMGMEMPGSPRPAGPQFVDAVEITGLAYLDKVPEGAAIRLRDALRESPFFTDQTEITASPVPPRDDFVADFTIKAVLKDPIAL